MKSQFYANGELRDEKVIEALNEALCFYENGELLEARETLADIVKAIDEFDRKYSPYEEPEYPKLPKDKAIAATVTLFDKRLIRAAMESSILKKIA